MEFEDLSYFGSFKSFESGKEDNNIVLKSPRKSSAPILIQYFQQSESLLKLNQWIQENIIEYLKQKTLWHTGIYPQRLMYLYGIPGIGKLSTVVSYCAKHRINLIYVNDIYYVDSMHETIFAKAKANTPCIIYYDKVDNMVTEPAMYSAFAAMYRVMLDVYTDDVWTILSGTNDVSVMSPHLSEMLYKYGSLVYAPIPTNAQYKTEVITRMLKFMAGTDDFPYKIHQNDPLTMTEWDRFIKQLLDASEYSSFLNIWEFLILVFRKFKQSVDYNELNKQVQSCVALINSDKYMYPDISLFQQYFNTLTIRRDTNCNNARTLLKDQPDPPSRAYWMDQRVEIYYSFHPHETVSNTTVFTPPPSITPTSHKSNTTPVPLIKEDEASFSLTPLKFSTPTRLDAAPVAKSSSELKKPSLAKRERPETSYYGEEAEDVEDLEKYDYDSKRQCTPSWITTKSGRMSPSMTCTQENAPSTAGDAFDCLLGGY